MRRPFLVLTAAVLFSGLVWSAKADAKTAEMTYVSSWSLSPEGLSNDRIGELDFQELNPHRTLWHFEKTVRWQELRATQVEKSWVLQAKGLRTDGLIRTRPEGSWYSLIADFSCSPEPQEGFATRAGAELAATTAARDWDRRVGRAQDLLAAQLGRVRADSEEVALGAARKILHEWLEREEPQWRGEAFREARHTEWRHYLQEGSRLGVCAPQAGKRRKDGRTVVRPEVRAQMEPPSADVSRKQWVRAPARRWGGLYSIRLSLVFGPKTLIGQFLVDSGSAVSAVSPAWLRSQGITPEKIEQAGAAPVRVSWSGGSGLAKRAIPLRAEIADVPVITPAFLLMETDLFETPQYPSGCCDGILGMDFLRHYAVELYPTKPAAVVLLDPRGYSLGQGVPWIEARFTPAGDWYSPGCALKSRSSGRSWVGVRWDSGSEMATDLHAPWLSQLPEGASRNSWSINCEGAGKVAEAFSVTSPNAEALGGEGSPFRSKVPAATVGMEILGRGTVVLDAANGRIWIPRETVSAPVLENRSGLDLEFELAQGAERQLRVKAIRPGSAAAALERKSGLKVGDLILALAGRDVEDLDSWQVEQLLSGAESTSLNVEWQVGKGRKVAPLKLR
jgi:hypothetical protein